MALRLQVFDQLRVASALCPAGRPHPDGKGAGKR